MFGHLTCVSSVYDKEVMVKIRKWRPFCTPSWILKNADRDFRGLFISDSTHILGPFLKKSACYQKCPGQNYYYWPISVNCHLIILPALYMFLLFKWCKVILSDNCFSFSIWDDTTNSYPYLLRHHWDNPYQKHNVYCLNVYVKVKQKHVGVEQQKHHVWYLKQVNIKINYDIKENSPTLPKVVTH